MKLDDILTCTSSYLGKITVILLMNYLCITTSKTSFAYYIPLSFSAGLEQADAVVAGKVNLIGRLRDDSCTACASNEYLLFSMTTEVCFKGINYCGETIYIKESAFAFSCHGPVIDKEYYLLFLKSTESTENDAAFLDDLQSIGIYPDKVYMPVLDIPWKSDSEMEVREAITSIQGYRNTTSRDERVELLLSLLQKPKPNQYLSNFIEHEVVIQHVTEAIPYYESMLNNESEQKKLGAISTLRILGYQKTGEVLLAWLKDPEFQNKIGIMDELIKLNDDNTIPEIRKYTESEDELIRVHAAIALLEYDESESKEVLFDVLMNGSDNIARYNAIHILNWNYSGDFSKEEEQMIVQLLNDKDESIRRVAGFIIERIKLEDQ